LRKKKPPALRITKLLKCFILTLLTTPRADAQTIERFNSFSYNVNEGLLQSTIADMAFDKNNFCWISFPNGIQKFDGKNFIVVPVQPGLPDDKLVYFFRCSNGDLLISHSQGISKYEITGNKFIQVYNNSAPVRRAVRFIGQDGNTIYFYSETGIITGLNYQTFKVFSETKTNLPNYSLNTDYKPRISDNIINHKVALQIKSRVYLWDLQKKELLYRSDSIPSISHVFLLLKTESEVLYYTYKVNNALQCYNFTTKSSSILPIRGKDDKVISRCIIYPWQNKTLISFNGNLYETDSTLQVLRSELVNFQNQPAGGPLVIWGIREDNFGNLYLLTVTGGIKKIIRNNYPVKYYGTEKKDSNIVMSILPDKKNNRILTGTSGNGLLIFDTLQRVVKHIKSLPGETKAFFALNTIIKNNKGDYLLFINGEKVLWQLSKDLSQFSRIKFSTAVQEEKSGIQFFGTTLFQNEERAIVQSQGMLYKTNFAVNTVTEHAITQSYTMGGLLYDTMIITHANDELIFLDAETLIEIKRIPFKNTGHVRCFTKDAANYIYMGSNKGIFKISSAGKIVWQLKKENGLPDECIYAMVFDDDGFLWCSTNKGVFKVNRDNSILQLKKEDGLQENEFNTNVVAKAADGEIFFGGVNGLSSFYPAAISSFEEKINLLVTKIKINNEETFKDTAVWDIQKINLPHHQNSLAFDFIAMANNNPGQYIYQYKMEGIDKQWIQNTDLQTVRYFLPPGEYVFKIYASRFFDKDAKPMKVIHITINQPFWKTWWFISASVLLIITLIAYAINRYNKRKYEKKLMELEAEHKLQLERERISRDLHDSIGAYANAVLYNTELLQKEEDAIERNELMNDLKFASKDIITSLRETIWALKKDKYTAEDCFFRIKNFIQSLARYYPHIKFTVEGEAPLRKELHYTKALNVVRIVQEAVTNAIKHGAAGSIKITSYEKDDRWQMAVINDGNGFNYEEMKKAEQGNGLDNMKQRAVDSGFDFNVESNEGIGTKISILI
jgi:signal transduction histidine kinase